MGGGDGWAGVAEVSRDILELTLVNNFLANVLSFYVPSLIIDDSAAGIRDDELCGGDAVRLVVVHFGMRELMAMRYDGKPILLRCGAVFVNVNPNATHFRSPY
jgi:hypothetical protein